MLPFLFILLKIGRGDTILLDGDESRASFMYRGPCDLVKPIGRNSEEEDSLFKYYQKQTSRLTVDKKSAAFKIQNPTYREALQWSCCKGPKSGDSISDCQSAESHLIATVPFSPVQINQVSRFFTRDSGRPELVTILIKADVARPRVDNIIPAFDLQLVLDADPDSCAGNRFTRKFNYRVPTRPAHDRNSVRFLSFSDDLLPQNCRLTMFLQKPCEQFPSDCKAGGFFYYSSSVTPTLFNTTFSSEDKDIQIIDTAEIITGKKLDVLFPLEPPAPALSYHEQGDALFTELPKAPPVIISGYSDADIFHCEASGYPIPILELHHPNSDDVLQKPKCERTKWNRMVCRWQITPNQRLFPYTRCRAKNELATATKNIPINDHVHRIEHLTSDSSKISVHGISNHSKSNVLLVAKLQLAPAWSVRQNILTSRMRAGGLKWKLKYEDVLVEYKKTLLKEVEFVKDGSPSSFACGRRKYTVELDDKTCLKPEGKCYAFIRLEILFPDVDDSGEYQVSLVNASPHNKYRISQSVRIDINEEPNPFTRDLYLPKTPDGRFSVFEMKQCTVLNSESIDCRWWPSFNTSQTTPIYSVHAFDQKVCLDELAPYNTTVVTVKDIPIHPPSYQQLIIRDLIPGHFYKVTVCAWQRDEINRLQTESGSLLAVIDGRGQRKCLNWPHVIQMPEDRPKYFIEPPSLVRDALDRTEFAYSTQDIKDLASVDINRFQVVFTMNDLNTRNARFGQCRHCPKLRFLSQLSEGTNSYAGPIPRGVIIQPFPRGFNEHGFGPYLDEMEPRRDAEEIIESDATITSYEIQFSEVKVRVLDYPGDYFEVKWNINRKYFKKEQLILMDYEGRESGRKIIDLKNAQEKELTCFLYGDDFSCTILVPIQANIVSFESVGGTVILSIFLNKYFLQENDKIVKSNPNAKNYFIPPYLAEVRREVHSFSIKAIPRTALFHNDFQALVRPVIFTVNLGLYSFTESPDKDGLTFRERVALTPRKNADFSAYEIEYEIRTCAISSKVDPTPRIATCRKTKFSDVTISLTQSFVGEEDIYSPESLRVLIEPDRAGIRQEHAIMEYVKTIEPPEVVLSPVPSQDLLAIADVSSGRRLAFGIESELEVQTVPMRNNYACEEIETFEEVKESYTTTTFVLPRLGTDGVSFYGALEDSADDYELEELRTHIGTRENSRREVPIGLPSIVTQKIKSFGGIDGYATHCGGSLIGCINTFINWSPRQKSIKGNGLLQLPQLSQSTYYGYDRNGCHYCYRSRYVFRGLEPALAGESGLKGNWSAGRHYENVGKLEDTCIWAEKPVTQKLQVLPSTVEKTFDTQPTPTKPDPPILPTSIVVKVGVLIVVMLLSCVCALMILKRHCCRKDEHHHAAIRHHNSRTNRHEYFPGNIGSRCDVGGHPSELSEGNGINDHTSSFDSGIDRRSVTPPASTSSNTYAPPPAAPPKNNK
ncbi:Oidioi.mRNA.OKI2018_I69.PAR.g11959.t2.cds [Oikopleura dioica]|uniref:Oidioi.mRNA.OKI2018_I69.PAR.g11959.t2.cds n=1 Tax=Oikopleura dioica TaxID=34765 RepID=A0ABN7RY30_OIKDI|nr:Oidioi.mRNA.OKI2018_I69.PAR.g11959.t2.cds [Oikopleura dioica]